MRALLTGDPAANEFADQLLSIGNNTLPVDQDGLITIPPTMATSVETTAELKAHVFPNFLQNYTNHHWLAERAILAPKNDIVNGLNADIVQMLPTETHCSS